jgi:WD40 repeat protein
LRLAFDPKGTLLAASTPEGRIRLLNVRTGKVVRVLTGHSSTVYTLAFSPSGTTLASGGREGRVKLWDPETGKQKNHAAGHDCSPDELAISSHGDLLASAGYDRTVRLWDISSGKELQRFAHSSRPCYPRFAARQKRLAWVADERIYLWMGTGSKRHTIVPGVKRLHQLAFVADGDTLASVGSDDAVQFFNVRTAKEVRSVRLTPARDWSRTSLSSDGRHFAIPRGTEINFFSLLTGKLTHTIPTGETLSTLLAVSPDGKRVLWKDNRSVVYLWDVDVGRQLVIIDSPDIVFTGAFSPTGRVLALAGENTIRLYEVATGGRVRQWSTGDCTPDCLAFFLDGTRLVSGNNDSTILLWDVTRRPTERTMLKRVSPRERESLWQDLAKADAARAYDAIWRLASGLDQTTAFLKGRLPPVRALDPRTLSKRIAQLDDDDFTVRQKATATLDLLGLSVEKALRKALATPVSAESRSRLRRLLTNLEKGLPSSPSGLQQLRAIELLESMGTAEARRLLTAVAAGEPAAWLTREAKASLQRLAWRAPLP